MSVTVTASLFGRQSLVSYLRAALPAKVASINAGRTASLVAAVAGPYVITGTSARFVTINSTVVTLPIGSSVSTNTVVSTINAAAPPGVTATNPLGAVQLNGTTIVIGSDGGTGANAVFGWTPGTYSGTLGSFAGPYNLSAMAKVFFGASVGGEVAYYLTAGTRTAAQVVTDLAGLAAPLSASADSSSRLVISTSTAPVTGTASIVSIGSDSGSGINAVFGWDTGGEQAINSALVAPGYRGVADGWPQSLSEMGNGFVVIVDDSRETPRSNIRTDIYYVEADVIIAWADPSNNVARNKEPIAQCLRAVREVILEDRNLGTAPGTSGRVIYLTETSSGELKGRPLVWDGRPFDAAMLKVKLHAYEAHAP